MRHEDDHETYAILGAAMEVHRVLGSGFLEAVYCDALVCEFVARAIPHVRGVLIHIDYKGATLRSWYRADFSCFDSVIVEVKALRMLTNNERAQTLNYLKATTLDRALLINFGSRRLEYERFVSARFAHDTQTTADG